jgi:hypothetical protein
MLPIPLQGTPRAAPPASLWPHAQARPRLHLRRLLCDPPEKRTEPLLPWQAFRPSPTRAAPAGTLTGVALLEAPAVAKIAFQPAEGFAAPSALRAREGRRAGAFAPRADSGTRHFAADGASPRLHPGAVAFATLLEAPAVAKIAFQPAAAFATTFALRARKRPRARTVAPRANLRISQPRPHRRAGSDGSLLQELASSPLLHGRSPGAFPPHLVQAIISDPRDTARRADHRLPRDTAGDGDLSCTSGGANGRSLDPSLTKRRWALYLPQWMHAMERTPASSKTPASPRPRRELAWPLQQG